MRIAKSQNQDLQKRTLDYAGRIANVCAALPDRKQPQIVAAQLFRSGTSVGAQVAEANRAKSRADFVSKMEGAMQELEETTYWIQLLIHLGFVRAQRLAPLLKETDEIMAILVTMVSRSRRNS